jgi:uncharacterized protein YjiS (DUF1127 family)
MGASLHEKSSGRIEKRCFADNRLVALVMCSLADAHWLASPELEHHMPTPLARMLGRGREAKRCNRRLPTPAATLHAIGVWMARSAQRKALRALAQEARLLSDLGLDRQQALEEAAKPFWRR